ncbi:MAG: glycosyltransferase family 4 protein, partial [Acidobacteriota bacterium]|nr:glycosyltransferase family 4 protein [Acidobacteriota bacterium]
LHRFLLGIEFGRKAGALAAELSPVLYHAHDLNAVLAGFFGRRRHRAPFVYDAHELWPHRNRQDGTRLKRWFAARADRFSARHANSVITVNESIAEHIEQSYRLKGVVVVRNTPSLSKRVVPPPHALLDDVPRPLLFYVGGITFGRGLEEIIRALGLLPNGTLAIMGPGKDEFREGLRRIAEEVNVSERVRFIAPVPMEAVVSTVAQADLGISLIKRVCLSYYLSLPNKFFEYLHASVPILASDFPEMRRLVHHFGVGACCDPDDVAAIADCLRSLLADPVSLAKMGENARRAAQELNWEKEQEQLLSLYTRLLKSSEIGTGIPAIIT